MQGSLWGPNIHFAESTTHLIVALVPAGLLQHFQFSSLLAQPSSSVQAGRLCYLQIHECILLN